MLADAFVFSEQRPTNFDWSDVGGFGEGLFTTFYGRRLDEWMAYAYYDPDRFVSQQLVDSVEAARARPGAVRAALEVARGTRFEHLEARYAEVDRPALLIWGQQDRVTPPSFGRRLAAALPRARFVVIDRAGHFPMIEQARRFSALVRDFLDGSR